VSFAPELFYDIATWLCGDSGTNAGVRSDEVALRTAISRTYYAAHLLAREVLVKKGWKPPRGEVHGAVLAELRRRNKPRLAGDLASLQRLRNHADYHIETDSGHSADICRLCEELKTPNPPDVVNGEHWKRAARIAPGLISLLVKF